jgi:hypothetical protein
LVIDYVVRRDDISFLEAVKSLGGDAVPIPLRDAIPSPQRDAAPVRLMRSRSDQVPFPTSGPRQVIQSSGLPPETWQEKGRDFVLKASKALLNDPKASIARAYLESRRLEKESWLAGLLGYTQVYDPKLKVKRPAVCIPHLDGKLNLSAIKYRFCDSNPAGLRSTSHKGSRVLLYGLDGLLPKEHDTLLVVEGELNQLSILQTLSEHAKSQPGVSVLSPGSEGMSSIQGALLRLVARCYEKVIIWMDKGSVAKQVAGLIQVLCRKLRSPKGMDANDLLRDGILWRFLEGVVASRT